jgi:HEAT repeat protein
MLASVTDAHEPRVEGAIVPSDGSPPTAYKNLFVPLVVVPALIVGAILLVFLFFGAISGREASLSENLDRAVHGGQAERKQAAFNMVRQVAENRRARLEHRDLPWPVESDFLSRLRSAWDSTSTEDPSLRLVLASLLAQLDDPQGIPSLIALLDTPQGADPKGEVRFNALANLGALGDPRAEAPAIRILEQSQDPGLRAVAAIALQHIPGDAGLAALRAALDDPLLEIRANAAIALSMRGDPAGSSVLRDLLDPSVYSAEHGRDGAKFSQPRRVSESRVAAIEALSRLHRAEDRSAIERVADQDSDLAVREAAMKALDGWR